MMVGHITKLLLACLCVASLALAEVKPEVTLSHGGKLRGIRTTFIDQDVDLYLGVRYAEAPVDKLRFKKPVPAAGWAGTVDATEVGQNCPQPSQAMPEPGEPLKVSGTEDCLFLDVTVPAGTQPGDKKPVMVFIHGGGYSIGSRSLYVGAGLATHGDVIMVTVNYRLGILGFLFDESGAANFGLWDQREALIWVQKNIAAFGGDPDMVTIFGESAGGGSVSAQTMGQQNDGLFKRAITQSGTLYMMFDISANTRQGIIDHFRQATNCAPEVESVFDCFHGFDIQQIIPMTMMDGRYLIPLPDGDFFPDSVKHELYDISHRFDLMAGMNGQEGGLMYAFELTGMAAMMNKTTNEGVDVELMHAYLNYKCGQFTPLSVELCVSFIVSLYELDKPTCDKERAIYLTELLGEALFNVDTVNQLEQHAPSDKSTYAYYFTELYKMDPPNPLWTTPDWLITKADHGFELAFVFGATFFKTGKAMNDVFLRVIESDKAFADMFLGKSEKPEIKKKELEYETLARRMMTLWTNFAKTGNPNKPMPIDTPEWPAFTSEEGKFMELNLNNPQVIDTPHRERVRSFKRHIMTARSKQLQVDRPTSTKESMQQESAGHDEL